jgi:sphinganine-1-phosphate aldolase
MSYVYDAGREDAGEAARQALAAFGEVNALDPITFPSVARLENDLVAWGLGLTHARNAAVGTATSGGSETCILAVLAARHAWRERRVAGTPTIVTADTAHPAFAKAAHLLAMDVHVVPVDRSTLQLTSASVESALESLGHQAALVVASAPSYAHGVVDDIPGIARVADRRGIPCHVDACIGGVVLGVARRLGRTVPEWDMSVQGVSSLGLDLHKYGFAPKGISLLLFDDAAYRQGTYFAYSTWPGYPLINTTLQSTKSAGPLAAAWAALAVLGDSGINTAIDAALRATELIARGVAAIPGVRVVGRPDATLLALAGDPDARDPDGGIDPFRLADAMHARGWVLQPQPGLDDLPRTVHLTVQPVSLETIDTFLGDLAASAGEAAQLGWCRAPDDLAEAFAALPDLTSGGALPETMAGVHALIDALPPEVRDPALQAIVGALFTARR